MDSFSAALLGLPKLLKEADVHAEYPADVDDENVTERGFQPTLPGESTKLSSALALFRASGILSKVLEETYPASASHELSLQSLGMLSDELDSWLSSLAPHLRLQFVQDKPSTNVVSSRSPLLVRHYGQIVMKLADRDAVTCILLHSYFDSSPRSGLEPGSQVVALGYDSRGREQAYHSDHTIA